MNDFVSTRPGVDKQTAACSQLLTAVIALAIKDLCRPPNPFVIVGFGLYATIDACGWRGLFVQCRIEAKP
jgi:hypothetical protein